MQQSVISAALSHLLALSSLIIVGRESTNASKSSKMLGCVFYVQILTVLGLAF